jgi:hypothetical protein
MVGIIMSVDNPYLAMGILKDLYIPEWYEI